MKWIKKHKMFSVITGIVVALCLVIVISYVSIGGSSFLGRSLHNVMIVVEKPVAGLAAGIRDTFAGIFNYGTVLEENKELKDDIYRLQEENKNNKLTKSDLRELRKLEKVFNYDAYDGSGDVVAGRIIEMDNSKPYVIFTVNAGKNKGVKKGDIVADGRGLVGRVREAGSNWARISSILNDSNNIGFKVLRNTSVMGVVSGNGKDALEGYVLNENSRVIKGDVLVTSGIGLYPQGIRIGTVTEVRFDEDRQLRTVTLEPTVKFETMQKVAIFI